MHTFCNTHWLPQFNIPLHTTLLHYLPLSGPKHNERLGYFLFFTNYIYFSTFTVQTYEISSLINM